VCESLHQPYVSGTGIELEVLFDAKVHGGLDWAHVIQRIDCKGPLLIILRTDSGYARDSENHDLT
jgi:hypothetical protein